MTAQLDVTVLDFERLGEFVAKVQGDQAAAYNAILVHLGDRLGLWRALATSATDGVPGTATVTLLAERSGVAPRYLQEWLSAQAAHGYVSYDAESETFSLSPEAAAVLAEEESPASLSAGFELIAGVWAAVDKLATAYTTGEGVPWHAHDPRVFSSVARFYGTMYRSSLLTEWFPAVPGLIESLEAGIHVLDVGCGLGVPTILLAEAFPNSTFVGVDYHDESIRQAKAAAVEAGVTDRVEFHASDATSYDGTYDLVLLFDALHPGLPPSAGPGRGRRALRRGHPRGEPGQPGCRGVLRRELGAVRPAQHQRGRDGAGRAGGPDEARRRLPRRRLRSRGCRDEHGLQPRDRGARLRCRG
jgi:hypothetical protein